MCSVKSLLPLVSLHVSHAIFCLQFSFPGTLMLGQDKGRSRHSSPPKQWDCLQSLLRLHHSPTSLSAQSAPSLHFHRYWPKYTSYMLTSDSKFAFPRTQSPTSILKHSRIQVFKWCSCQQSISQLCTKFIFNKSLL